MRLDIRAAPTALLLLVVATAGPSYAGGPDGLDFLHREAAAFWDGSRYGPGAAAIPRPAFPKNLSPANRPLPDTAPVFPEDGSLVMRTWYYGSRLETERNRFHLNSIRSALASEGVEARSIGFDYEWIQDVALFDSGGALMLMADMPDEALTGLTIGVCDREDGFARVRRLSEENAGRLGLRVRMMERTFIEGGEMVTGRFADGSTYAIVRGAALRRTQVQMRSRGFSPGSALDSIARDLGIASENLIIVEASGHLDLLLQALPGGGILLSDPTKTVEVLNKVLSGNVPGEERHRLAAMLELYTEGYQARYAKEAPPDVAGKPMGGPVRPYDPGQLAELAAIESSLSARFRVVRAAGIFKEPVPYANAEPGEGNLYVAEQINFFNGFTGRSPQGHVFIVTNTARGLSSIEAYWREVLSGQGIAPGHIHFIGRYSEGAGIDCEGAGSGR